MSIRGTVAILAGLFVAAEAHANDSAAVIGAGGLELTKSDSIVMESEDLYLSLPEVRVSYVFRNTSDRDVETVVAFPLPDARLGWMHRLLDIPRSGLNFVGFSVRV